MKDKNSTIDVSINVTAHREGILLYKTLRSIRAGVELALKNNIYVEMNICLDKSDDKTREIVADFKNNNNFSLEAYEIKVGDLGKSRNYLINKSSGKYITFFDADDFFTENYIVDAFHLAEGNDKPAVYVAEHIINFEGNHCLINTNDSNSGATSKRFFFETNYYISQNFVHREIYESIKYRSNQDGYGFEDWQFNCEVLSEGYDFVAVPEVIFFYRRKRGNSMLKDQVASNVLIRKTKLYQPEVFSKLKSKQPSKNQLSEGQKTKSHKLKMIEEIIWKVRRKTQGHPATSKTVALSLGAARSLKRRVLANRLFISRYFADTQKGMSVYEKIEANKKDIPARLKNAGLTTRSVELWGKLNKYEPMIRASWDNLEYIPIIEYPTDSGMSNAYYDLCKNFGENRYTDLVLVPHMARGGAELATLHLLRALSSSGSKVLVMTTSATESPWGEKVKEIPKVDFIEGKELFLHVPQDEKQLEFLIKMLQNWTFERLTIINSDVGYRLVTKYKDVLKDTNCKVFVHTYAFDVTEDGYLFNYIPNGLVDMYGAVSKYVTDSKIYKKQLMEINGFKDKEITPLYLPANLKMNKKQNYKMTKKIMFAGRICNQKIADVAVQTGAMLAEHDIELHFYGNIDPEYAENDKFLEMIEPFPTVQYHGVFDGTHSLDFDEYDMFLLTTRTEGIPNTIIETCDANIFIVTAAVGGLPECIQQDKNGILVADEDKFSPTKYAEAILRAYDKNLFSNQKAINLANETVSKRHSLDNYVETLSSVMGLK